jgi:hypothetical protein
MIASTALYSSVSMAQSQPQSPPAATTAQAADKDPVICQKQEETGSRLGGHRVCMRRSQWEDRQLEDRKGLEKTQAQRTMQSGG